jgi:predicted small metal-binding protein
VPITWAYTTVEVDVMARIIQCECGFVARGQTDGEVIDAIRGHMRTDHPALLETVQQEDLLGWIKVE